MVNTLAHILRSATCQNNTHQCVPLDDAFASWLDMVNFVRTNAGVIYLVGNGASASMASHMAADLDKNGSVSTMVFNDSALLTALANDYSYDEVFSAPLRQRMKKSDLLIAISSSGNTRNILNACYTAHRMGGKVVTLSAMSKDNPLRQLGELNFHVAAETYGLAESAHNAILHHWMDCVALHCTKTS